MAPRTCPTLAEAGPAGAIWGRLLMSDAEYYVAQANFCLEVADKIADPDKVRWLILAGEWADMAELADASTAPVLA